MADAEVDAVDFELEEDDLMDDDTTMDDGNADVVPTPVPKLKSTIMGGTSQLDDGGPNKTKGRGFRKETDVECNSRFATREFESLDSDGGPRPQRCILSFHF
jgi:RNA-binding protein 8A